MKYFKKVQGDKIYLSPVNSDDVETYTEWINDLPTTINLGNASNVYGLLREKEILESMTKEGQNFAVVLNETDELIGNASLFSIKPLHRTATLGLFIGNKEHRNKGLGTEVVQLLVEYGFKVLNLNNIMLNVFEFNKGAIRAYEKAGFKEFGRRSEAFVINGRYYDDLYMQILAKDCKTSYLDQLMPN